MGEGVGLAGSGADATGVGSNVGSVEILWTFALPYKEGIVHNGFWTPKISACGGSLKPIFELFSTFVNAIFSHQKSCG